MKQERLFCGHQLRRKNIAKKKVQKIGKRVIKSKFEGEIYQRIKNVLPKGATIEYESDKLKYVIEYEYTPDFTITFKDGSKLFIETKGNGRQFDGHTRQKMVALKAQHPDKDIRIIFYRDGEFGASRKDGSRQRQSDWSKRVGYTFTINEVPEEWFK